MFYTTKGKNVKFYTMKENVNFDNATNENVMLHIDKKGNSSSKIRQNVKFRYQNNDYMKFRCKTTSCLSLPLRSKDKQKSRMYAYLGIQPRNIVKKTTWLREISLR